jgi:hypothetical protein
VITSEVNFGDQHTDERSDAVVTQFAVCGAWRPMSPPIMRQHRPVNDTAPQRTWREARRIEQFNEETGAMNASVEDLVELRTRLERACMRLGQA